MRRLYAKTMLIYLGNLSILEFGVHGDPGTNPPRTPRDDWTQHYEQESCSTKGRIGEYGEH